MTRPTILAHSASIISASLLAATLLTGAAAAQETGSSNAKASQPAVKTATIWKNGSRDGMIGAADTFTGTAYVEPVFPNTDPFVVNAGKVTFLPGARANWHTHPAGQMLIVTEGTGWYRVEGEPVQTMQAGDVVWFPPNVNHWHGATATTAVTHYAVQQFEDGENVVWGEPVSDADYRPEATVEASGSAASGNATSGNAATGTAKEKGADR